VKGKAVNRLIAAALLCAALGACAAPNTSESAAMATDTKDTKPAVTTFCMGRFVIDLPAGSTISGGNYKYDFARIEKPRAVSKEQFEKELSEREAKLKSTKHRKEPSLLRSAQRPDATSMVLAYWEEDFSEYQVKVDGHKWTDGVGFLVKDQVDTNKQDFGLKRMTETLAHLRPRPDSEIPTEPGYCFGGGFIANAEWENEAAGTDFRIAGQPDARISVDIFPLASRKRDKPLLERMGSAAAQLGSMATMVRVLRKGDREIASVKGQEYLASGPNSGGLRGHVFMWETQGEGTLQEPFVKIEMQTSAQDDKGNPQQTRLTDEQAIALWDRIVASFRLRPVSAAPAKKTSDAGPPDVPLGTQAATGRLCPQTGLWECEEAAFGTVQGGRQLFLNSGQPMPRITVLSPPGMWQKLRGQQPAQTTATMWTLVGYDEPASAPPPMDAADAEPDGSSPPPAASS
jgi:Tle cognate immunity protein 4 C-terminal domain/Tle cognate immunity protein 4 N-terminal domain